MRVLYGLLAATLAFGAGSNFQTPALTTVEAIAVDALGNTYLTGVTEIATFPTTAGVFQPKFGGGFCVSGPAFGVPLVVECSDAFVVKLDPTGAVAWASYLGGSGSDAGSAIAVDAAGNVYVAGLTSVGEVVGVPTPVVDNFPTTTGSAFPTLAGTTGGFVVKIDPTGSQMLYGTYIPGTLGVAMAIDSNGSAYVAGSVEPGQFNFPTTAGAFQPSTNANVTGLVIKLNPAGSALEYATYLGANGAHDVTQTNGIAVDGSGNAYIVGTAPPDFPVTAGFETQVSQTSAFVAKLNAAGSGLVYATFLGSGSAARAVKVDSLGRAYILGSSADFPTTPGAFEPAPTATTIPPAVPGSGYSFLAALSSDGSSLDYATYVAGAAGLDVDAAGDAYVTGNSGPGFPVSAGAFEQCYSSNAFAAEFSPAGALLGATYFGPVGTLAQPAVAVGQNALITLVAQGLEMSFLIDNPDQTDGPCISTVVENAASYVSGAIAPGELIAVQGVGIGPQSGAVSSPGVNGLMPTELAGVQVFFDEIAAPLMFVQATEINVAVPWEIAGRSSTQVRVVYNGVSTNTAAQSVVAARPGLFYLGYTSTQGAILNADGSFNSASSPAKAGDVIALYGTGGGPTNPAGVTGGYWGDSSTALALPVTVQIGGVNAPVIYAGAAPGLLSTYFQINVRVPAGLGSNPAAPVSLYIGPAGGTVTNTGVTVAVQ